VSAMSLLDESDLDWVSEVVDVVSAAAGQPWRVALERLDDTRRAEQPRAPARFGAVVNAIQRVLGGRARNGPAARAARSLVLGRPALTEAEREARIAFAAQELAVTCAAVEKLLWSDLPRERPVELPRGRPSELEVAATANVHLLQRAMMRAQTVKLRVWGNAGQLIHTATARGLLTTLSRGERGETVLDIVGPLGLFHRTAVYGRTLAGLVPLLADCDRFELGLLSRGRDQLYAVEVSSPVLLPAVPARMSLPDYDLMRLTKELARVARDIAVIPQPAPIVAGASLVCPDAVLQFGGRVTHVELVGFWTIEFLENKLALYRRARIEDVVFCVDESRGCTKEKLPASLPVVQYTKHMTAAARQLAERIKAA
jgi:predicted nuclease of restriction endonuclease-like RecB superfamily